MSQTPRISLDPQAPDSLYTGALKINAALDGLEAELESKVSRVINEDGSVTIPIGGGFQCRFNPLDDSVDIEFKGAGIPYEKIDTAFQGLLENVELV